MLLNESFFFSLIWCFILIFGDDGFIPYFGISTSLFSYFFPLRKEKRLIPSISSLYESLLGCLTIARVLHSFCTNKIRKDEIQ